MITSVFPQQTCPHDDNVRVTAACEWPQHACPHVQKHRYLRHFVPFFCRGKKQFCLQMHNISVQKCRVFGVCKLAIPLDTTRHCSCHLSSPELDTKKLGFLLFSAWYSRVSATPCSTGKNTISSPLPCFSTTAPTRSGANDGDAAYF